MSNEKYGIGKVVGGFGRPLTPEESIPYTLKRTYLEHTMLRGLIKTLPFADKKFSALEVGCGYGRNLPILTEFSNVYGIERDAELAGLAAHLNPAVNIHHGLVYDQDADILSSFDLILTFTFLQHLFTTQLQATAYTITKLLAPGGYLILCEETDPAVTDQTCVGRTVEEYQDYFCGALQFIGAFPRITERVPNHQSGHFMLFRKNL
jgi:SAM-dependent methyltransferase